MGRHCVECGNWYTYEHTFHHRCPACRGLGGGYAVAYGAPGGGMGGGGVAGGQNLGGGVEGTRCTRCGAMIVVPIVAGVETVQCQQCGNMERVVLQQPGYY